jgi:hypothetical protein
LAGVQGTGELDAEAERRRARQRRLAKARDVKDHCWRRRQEIMLTPRRFRATVNLLKALMDAGFLKQLDPVSVEAAINRALREWTALRLARAKKCKEPTLSAGIAGHTLPGMTQIFARAALPGFANDYTSEMPPTAIPDILTKVRQRPALKAALERWRQVQREYADHHPGALVRVRDDSFTDHRFMAVWDDGHCVNLKSCHVDRLSQLLRLVPKRAFKCFYSCPNPV